VALVLTLAQTKQIGINTHIHAYRTDRSKSLFSGHHTCAHGPERRGTTPALQMAGSLVAMTVCNLVYIIEDLVNPNAFIFRKVDSGSNKVLKALPSTCSLSWSVT
jgi:hypothetical protein